MNEITNVETPGAIDPVEAPKFNKVHQEAARYRTERNQLRDELAKANARIEAYQRAEVTKLASELAVPEDVFTLSGSDLAAFLAEDGSVSADAVAAAVTEILTERPGLAKASRAVDPTQGSGAHTAHRKPSWTDLFR